MDYSTVTEAAGNRVSQEALAMLYARYAFAAALCQEKSVLEVACGSGQGLGLLAAKARRLVGGDYTEGLLRLARNYYDGRVPLVKLDAHKLPFLDRSFDVVILYEAIYYLARPYQFLSECNRILHQKGVLLICTVNREWSDFNPSPFSTSYFSARELNQLLADNGYQVELYGAFPVSTVTARDMIVSLIKRMAIKLHLVPKTMKGKEVLKRLFFGKLAPIPPEITEGMAELCPLVALNGESNSSNYKVLYAVGRSD